MRLLDDKTITQINLISDAHLSKYIDKFIFGSWADGTARKFSDIDIGLEGDKEIDNEIKK